MLDFLVGYVAFRGYRRNESRPMLFVAPGMRTTVAAAPSLVGLLCLLYGLWNPRREN